MTFLNKKEDVIDIRLTAYGKKLLSKGRFKPEYYAFFDDGITYRKVNEEQNNIQNRIKEDLTLSTQVEVAGVETRFDIETKRIAEGARDLYERVEEAQDPVTNSKLLKYQLANQQLLNRDMPSINLTMLSTAFINENKSELFLTSSIVPSTREGAQGDGIVTQIPQLVIEPEYTLCVDKTEQVDIPSVIVSDEDEDMNLMAKEIHFLDNTKIIIKDEKVIFSVVENNVEYTNENFEIEIYEIIENSTKKDQILQLETMEEILDRFIIKTDESVDNYSLVRRNQKNIFGKSREKAPEPKAMEESGY